MTSDIHRQITNGICSINPLIKTTRCGKRGGFKQDIKTLIKELWCNDEEDFDEEIERMEDLPSYSWYDLYLEILPKGWEFLPDAYLIDREEKELLLFEVDISHSIYNNRNRTKLKKVVLFLDSFDWHFGPDWSVGCIVYSRNGHGEELPYQDLIIELHEEIWKTN